jgi:hypothetical protein
VLQAIDSLDLAVEALFEHTRFHEGAFELYQTVIEGRADRAHENARREFGGETLMGYARPRPQRLAAKLFLIRRRLGVSQPQLAKRLNAGTPYETRIPYNHISKYEHDKNEPPLMVLLAYSRVSRIPLPNIIDDDLDL